MMAKKEQAGFALIEVLIAILLLAAGAVGAAGMQLSSLRGLQHSKFRTAAVELASEMADKMRANSTQMKSAANPFVGVDFQASPNESPEAPSLCYGAGANCDSNALAKFDLYEWKVRIAQELPSGRAVICRDGNPWGGSGGGLRWECTAPGSDDFGLVIKLGWAEKGPDGKLVGDGAVLPQVVIAVEPYVK
jgi:type IV pilus assembly protein PilV